MFFFFFSLQSTVKVKTYRKLLECYWKALSFSVCCECVGEKETVG